MTSFGAWKRTALPYGPLSFALGKEPTWNFSGNWWSRATSTDASTATKHRSKNHPPLTRISAMTSTSASTVYDAPVIVNSASQRRLSRPFDWVAAPWRLKASKRPNPMPNSVQTPTLMRQNKDKPSPGQRILRVPTTVRSCPNSPLVCFRLTHPWERVGRARGWAFSVNSTLNSLSTGR